MINCFSLLLTYTHNDKDIHYQTLQCNNSQMRKKKYLTKTKKIFIDNKCSTK